MEKKDGFLEKKRQKIHPLMRRHYSFSAVEVEALFQLGEIHFASPSPPAVASVVGDALEQLKPHNTQTPLQSPARERQRR